MWIYQRNVHGLWSIFLSVFSNMTVMIQIILQPRLGILSSIWIFFPTITMDGLLMLKFWNSPLWTTSWVLTNPNGPKFGKSYNSNLVRFDQISVIFFCCVSGFGKFIGTAERKSYVPHEWMHNGFALPNWGLHRLLLVDCKFSELL